MGVFSLRAYPLEGILGVNTEAFPYTLRIRWGNRIQHHIFLGELLKKDAYYPPLLDHNCFQHVEVSQDTQGLVWPDAGILILGDTLIEWAILPADELVALLEHDPWYTQHLVRLAENMLPTWDAIVGNWLCRDLPSSRCNLESNSKELRFIRLRDLEAFLVHHHFPLPSALFPLQENSIGHYYQLKLQKLHLDKLHLYEAKGASDEVQRQLLLRRLDAEQAQLIKECDAAQAANLRRCRLAETVPYGTADRATIAEPEQSPGYGETPPTAGRDTALATKHERFLEITAAIRHCLTGSDTPQTGRAPDIVNRDRLESLLAQLANLADALARQAKDEGLGNTATLDLLVSLGLFQRFLCEAEAGPSLRQLLEHGLPGPDNIGCPDADDIHAFLADYADVYVVESQMGGQLEWRLHHSPGQGLASETAEVINEAIGIANTYSVADFTDAAQRFLAWWTGELQTVMPVLPAAPMMPMATATCEPDNAKPSGDTMTSAAICREFAATRWHTDPTLCPARIAKDIRQQGLVHKKNGKPYTLRTIKGWISSLWPARRQGRPLGVS